MKVKELIRELSKFPNQELDVIILGNNIEFKTIDEIEQTELGYKESNFEVKECIKLN